MALYLSSQDLEQIRYQGTPLEVGFGLYFKGEKIIEEKGLPLSGEHNVYNALFAIAAAKIVGVDAETIKNALLNFKGVSFRMEAIAEKDGVKYINDSKSTNTASAITAVKEATCPTVLIIGGSEKGESYDELFRTIKDSAVKHAVITGASRRNMLAAADRAGYSDITVCADFDFAVRIAAMMATDGDAVLLSPACASFDAFSGFEERGERFNRIVESLP